MCQIYEHVQIKHFLSYYSSNVVVQGKFLTGILVQGGNFTSCRNTTVSLDDATAQSHTFDLGVPHIHSNPDDSYTGRTSFTRLNQHLKDGSRDTNTFYSSLFNYSNEKDQWKGDASLRVIFT